MIGYMGRLAGWTIFGLLLVAITCEGNDAQTRFKTMSTIRNELFGREYDKEMRPAGANWTGPVVVYVNVMVRNIESISDVKMEYKVQITFRQQWMDERLVYDNKKDTISYITLNDDSLLWVPDTYFKNEKEANYHDITKPNMYVRIFPDGGVLYSRRISLTLSCPMNLKLFPMDRQECQMLIGSYGWTSDDVVLLWKSAAPVQITPILHLPKFTLEKFITDYCNSKTNTGAYSCLRLDLVFRREFSSYCVRYYFPSCCLIAVAWLSFWLDEKAILARLSLVLTSLSIMVILLFNISDSVPTVSYTKAIDCWTDVCLAFLFAALLECVFVNSAFKSRTNSGKKTDKMVGYADGQIPMETIVGDDNVCNLHPKEKTDCCKKLFNKFPSRFRCADMVFLIVYPALFILFTVLYYIIYVQESNYYPTNLFSSAGSSSDSSNDAIPGRNTVYVG